MAGVIFASPHSGSIYPNDLLKRAKLSAHQLRRNEDIFVDHLFRCAIDAGAPILRALFPRVVVDVNRAITEFRHITARAAAGLGVVPTFLTESLPIYSRRPSEKEVEQRLKQLYNPYHKALSGLIKQAKTRFGRALLVDCHSMPGFAPMGSRRPDIILGDRFGTSCHSDTLAKLPLCRRIYHISLWLPCRRGRGDTNRDKPRPLCQSSHIISEIWLCPPERGLEAYHARNCQCGQATRFSCTISILLGSPKKRNFGMLLAPLKSE